MIFIKYYPPHADHPPTASLPSSPSTLSRFLLTSSNMSDALKTTFLSFSVNFYFPSWYCLSPCTIAMTVFWLIWPYVVPHCHDDSSIYYFEMIAFCWCMTSVESSFCLWWGSLYHLVSRLRNRVYEKFIFYCLWMVGWLISGWLGLFSRWSHINHL